MPHDVFSSHRIFHAVLTTSGENRAQLPGYALLSPLKRFRLGLFHVLRKQRVSQRLGVRLNVTSSRASRGGEVGPLVGYVC